MSRGVNTTASSSSFTSAKAIRKATFRTRLISFVDKFNKFVLIDADNVGSKHLQRIRLALRGRAEILMGKNSMIRNVLVGLQERYPSLEGIIPHLRGKTGLVFTDGDVGEIRSALMAIKVQKGAKVGSVAPIDVFIQPGDTNLEPTKTSFFQALHIPSRINKGRIAIDTKVHVVKAGEKVTHSQAALLQMLDIKPFYFGLQVGMVFDHSEGVYHSRQREEAIQSILFNMDKAILNIASLSFEVGYGNASVQALQERAKRMIGSMTTVDNNSLIQSSSDGEKRKKKAKIEDTSSSFGGLFGDDEEDDEEKVEVDEEDDGQVMNLFGEEDDEDFEGEASSTSTSKTDDDEGEEDEPMGNLFGGDDEDY